MNDFLDLKCEWEFSKIKDSYFQHLGVLKNAETSSNLAINFRMRFLILVHCVQKVCAIPVIKASIDAWPGMVWAKSSKPH